MNTTRIKGAKPRLKSERLEARLSPGQKKFFQRAAQLDGRTLTELVLNSVAGAAERVVRDSEAMTLSARDREVFVKALLNPQPPNKALKAAASWYKKKVGT